jgi:PAS domain S-box-containing protein
MPEDDLLRANQDLERKVAELTRALTQMRALLESTSEGLLVTDEEGRITDLNAAYVRMWGLPPALVEGRDHAKILDFVIGQLSPECQAEYRSKMKEIFESAPEDSLDTLTLASGHVIERSSRKHTAAGSPSGRIWSFREVTERLRAEREHAYLAAIVSSSSDAIIAKTLQGVITSWNAAAERLFGYTSKEAVGKPITMLIPDDRTGEEEMLLERLRRGEEIRHYETERRTKEGRRIRVSLTISPVKDSSGRIIGASKIVRDVTERDQFLARERAARTQAEEASRLKDEFLATASHELRTPLNAIVGWIQILRMGGLDDDKVQRAIDVIERSARAQAQVIDDLLDVSRIITGKLRLDVRPLMPAASIESGIDSVRPMADAKGVTLLAILDERAGPISGDAGRLQQIVWNLLSNAIKFTARGGTVQIRLECIESHLEIVVSDTGEGIGPEFLPYVFDRFRQADASAARFRGGLGLGLAIVRHLVELHGGVITADSAGKGKGATFTIQLPLRPVHALRDDERRVYPGADTDPWGRPAGEAPSLAGARILIVDDEIDAREVLREVLERCGAEVKDAPSAAHAIEIVKEWRPTVMVSDIGLPGEDGYALIRKVREWERGAGVWTPAVALTAYARNEDRMRALIAGYQLHIAKPIDPLELALVVAGIIHPSSQEGGGPRI